MFRSAAAMSILAVLTTAAAFGVEVAVSEIDVESAGPVAVTPFAAELRTAPVTLRTAPAAPEVTVSTFVTATTIADLTMSDIEVMRPVEDDAEFDGIIMSFSFGGSVNAVPQPPTRESCIADAEALPLIIDGVYDRNLVAQMTHQVFECLTGVAGLDDSAPTSLRRWDAAAEWGFTSLSDQVASEAVVVAYCESVGFDPRALSGSNGFGYAGLFQMGRTEMARFGERGSSRYDPIDSAVAAANYFIYQYRNSAGWGGWSPWAVVNTNFNDEINDRVKIPVLPRFVSTDPDFAGRSGPELPEWAVDPWSWEVPHWNGTGCPYNGGRWPAAHPMIPPSVTPHDVEPGLIPPSPTD